jgi:hypothetical protein
VTPAFPFPSRVPVLVVEGFGIGPGLSGLGLVVVGAALAVAASPVATGLDALVDPEGETAGRTVPAVAVRAAGVLVAAAGAVVVATA